MNTFVWVVSWQQQCCGEGFGVGSTVRWDAVRLDEGDDWVGELLGEHWAGRVEYREKHHGSDDEPAFP